MKKHLKLILVTVVLFFGVLENLKAQEKCDYAIVKYIAPYYVESGIFISISGKEFEKVEIKKDKVANKLNDYTVLLNYISSMTENGWHVLNNIANETTAMFILEKKS